MEIRNAIEVGDTVMRGAAVIGPANGVAGGTLWTLAAPATVTANTQLCGMRMGSLFPTWAQRTRRPPVTGGADWSG